MLGCGWSSRSRPVGVCELSVGSIWIMSRVVLHGRCRGWLGRDLHRSCAGGGGDYAGGSCRSGYSCGL